MLSPDETMLYVVNTQGAAVTAFSSTRAPGAVEGLHFAGHQGSVRRWSYLAGLALVNESGNGGGVYVAEFGSRPVSRSVRLKARARNVRCRK